jgi:hypothetical protein
MRRAHTDEAWKNVLKLMDGRDVHEKLVCDADAEHCTSVWLDYMDEVSRIAINNDDGRSVCVQKYKSPSRACWNLTSLQRTDETLDALNKMWIVRKSRVFEDAETMLTDSDQYFNWLHQRDENESLEELMENSFPFDGPSKQFRDEALYPRKR